MTVACSTKLSNDELDQTKPEDASEMPPLLQIGCLGFELMSILSAQKKIQERLRTLGLGRIVSGAIDLTFDGKNTTLYESKPKHSPRKFRRHKTTIIINTPQNCGNTHNTRTVNSHNDSSRVEVKSGDTFNTNNGDGTFTNAGSIYETSEGDDTVPPQEAPALEQVPPFPPEPEAEPYYTEWVIYIWSWVPCFSWNGWLSGWAAQPTPQICSQWVWP